MNNCEIPFQDTGSGQYRQNKGDLPLHWSPFLSILTSPVTRSECFAIVQGETIVKGEDVSGRKDICSD